MAVNPEWRDRIAHWLRVLRELCYLPLGGVELAYCTTLEHLSPEQALAKNSEISDPAIRGGQSGSTRGCAAPSHFHNPRQMNGSCSALTQAPRAWYGSTAS